MLTRDFPPKIGGIATYVSALARHLRAIGVEIDVFAGSSDSKTILLPLMKSFREYDLVHVQSSPYGVFVSGKPMIVTVHAPVLAELRHYTTNLKVKSLVAIICEKIALQKAAAVIADSQITKRDLVTTYGVSAKKILLIGLGVEYNKFAAQKTRRSGPARILLVSRLEPRKNVEEAIRTLSRLPPDEYEATVVGSGSQRTRLERLAIELRAKVSFLGKVSDDLLLRMYNDADIFLTTSHSEGFGLSVLEAMASGCAVVASPIPTHMEFISNNLNGMIYNGPSDLESKLKTLISTPELTRRFGMRGRESAKNYSWERVARQVLEVYNDCLAALKNNKR